jgi:hypothetical protein
MNQITADIISLILCALFGFFVGPLIATYSVALAIVLCFAAGSLIGFFGPDLLIKYTNVLKAKLATSRK